MYAFWGSGIVYAKIQCVQMKVLKVGSAFTSFGDVFQETPHTSNVTVVVAAFAYNIKPKA